MSKGKRRERQALDSVPEELQFLLPLGLVIIVSMAVAFVVRVIVLVVFGI